MASAYFIPKNELPPSNGSFFSNMNQQKSKRIESLPDSIRGKLGTKSCLELCKILNRFPIQNRRDQARQQPSAGTARRGSNCVKAQP